MRIKRTGLPVSLAFILLAQSVVFFFPASAQRVNITGPTGSGQFGSSVTVLPNGNYVVADPLYDEGGLTDIGAVYLYNGATHQVISVLKGSRAFDQVGIGGITVLTNGNYVVRSQQWDNGTAANAGAVIWCSASTGVNGIVSADNSLVGTTSDDGIGSPGITILTNGN